jgi:hypothetical protein
MPILPAEFVNQKIRRECLDNSLLVKPGSSLEQDPARRGLGLLDSSFERFQLERPGATSNLWHRPARNAGRHEVTAERIVEKGEDHGDNSFVAKRQTTGETAVSRARVVGALPRPAARRKGNALGINLIYIFRSATAAGLLLLPRYLNETAHERNAFRLNRAILAGVAAMVPWRAKRTLTAQAQALPCDQGTTWPSGGSICVHQIENQRMHEFCRCQEKSRNSRVVIATWLAA